MNLTAKLLPVILLLTLAPAAGAAQDLDYARELKATASALKLARDRTWIVLLHYMPTIGGWKSEADSPDFFMSPDGKTRPDLELAATLDMFFLPAADFQFTERQHPQCAFPARYAWLKERLGFDPARLPEQPCPAFEEWKETLAAKSVTLVFTTEYLNNPASMFAHTFLRFDRDQRSSLLLSYAVSYSASQTSSNPIIYSVFGLTGGFPGNFSTLPYYLKVEEYNSMENRDLWEYQLLLKPEQVDRMVRHTWELGQTHFNYFYLDENCSYHILSLIEAAQPSLRLRERFSMYVAPVDTIHEITLTPGLVGNVKFRPSLRRNMQALRAALSADEAELAEDIIDGDGGPEFEGLASLPPERQALVLDAAQSLYRYRIGYGLSKEKEALAAAYERKLQMKRARLARVKVDVEVPVPERRPDEAHWSASARLGGGADSAGPFGEFWIRPVLQDLLSRQAGYARDTQIEMLALRLRAREDSPWVYPVKADLLNIFSLTPVQGWVMKPSWKLRLGYGTPLDTACAGWSCSAFSISGGPGLAFRSSVIGYETLYFMGDLELLGGPGLAPWYGIGSGASTGLLLEFLPAWRLMAEAGYLFRLLGDPGYSDHSLRFTFGTNVALSENWEFRVVSELLPDRYKSVAALLGLYF